MDVKGSEGRRSWISMRACPGWLLLVLRACKFIVHLKNFKCSQWNDGVVKICWIPVVWNTTGLDDVTFEFESMVLFQEVLTDRHRWAAVCQCLSSTEWLENQTCFVSYRTKRFFWLTENLSTQLTIVLRCCLRPHTYGTRINRTFLRETF